MAHQIPPKQMAKKLAAELVVIHAGDGDRLRHVPVGRGEGQRGRRDASPRWCRELSARW